MVNMLFYDFTARDVLKHKQQQQQQQQQQKKNLMFELQL